MRATGLALAPTISEQAAAALLSQPQSFVELVALADKMRDIRLKIALEREVRVLHFEIGKIELALLPQAEADLPNRLAKALLDWTGQRWGISLARPQTQEITQKTLYEDAQAAKHTQKQDIYTREAVQALLQYFPGAEITNIRLANDSPLDNPISAKGELELEGDFLFYDTNETIIDDDL